MVINLRDVWIVVIEGGMMLLMNFMVLIGNFVMCFVIFNKFCFYIMMNLFIVCLVMCYLFVVCFFMLFIVGVFMVGRWFFGCVFCDI